MSDARTPRLALEDGSSSLRRLSSVYLREYFDKIRLASEGLADDQIWSRSTPHSNSIGNLILHLCGNLSLWIGASLGGREFVRDRKAEFTAERSAGRNELLRRLDEVVLGCRAVIEDLAPDDLTREHSVQGYEVSGLGVLFHAVEHMSYHTGQIVLMGKAMRDQAGDRLEFYPHLLVEDDS